MQTLEQAHLEAEKGERTRAFTPLSHLYVFAPSDCLISHLTVLALSDWLTPETGGARDGAGGEGAR